MIPLSVSAKGFEPLTVPIKIGMLYPALPSINFMIFDLLFHALISRSRLYAEDLSLYSSK